MNATFESKAEYRGKVDFPPFSEIRIQHMPIILGVMDSIPDFLEPWKPTLEQLWKFSDYNGQGGYVTIDEKVVEKGKTHRRGGPHVDGRGGWGGGGWGAAGTGMIVASKPSGCVIWRGNVEGYPGSDGECDHLDLSELSAELLGEQEVWWLDGFCVHESVPMKQDTRRQFIRISMPSHHAWHEGSTPNPLGIGPWSYIAPRRKYMD